MKRIEDIIPPNLKLEPYISDSRLAILMAGIPDIKKVEEINIFVEYGKIEKKTLDEIWFYLNLIRSDISNGWFDKFNDPSGNKILAYLYNEPHPDSGVIYRRLTVDHSTGDFCDVDIPRWLAFKWANEQFAKMYGELDQKVTVDEQEKPLRENQRETFLKIIAGLAHIIGEQKPSSLMKGDNINLSQVAKTILNRIEIPNENGKFSISEQTLLKEISKAIGAYPNIKKLFSVSEEE